MFFKNRAKDTHVLVVANELRDHEVLLIRNNVHSLITKNNSIFFAKLPLISLLYVLPLPEISNNENLWSRMVQSDASYENAMNSLRACEKLLELPSGSGRLEKGFVQELIPSAAISLKAKYVFVVDIYAEIIKSIQPEINVISISDLKNKYRQVQ